MHPYDKIVTEITKLIGRKPRGFRAVEVFNDSGDPSVIRVSSLVEKKPFPTLFWLVDRNLVYTIDQMEASGLIAKLQCRVDLNAKLQKAMWQDHQDHIHLRESYFTDEEFAYLDTAGYVAILRKRGIGGISNPTRIRCLHTWYAAHLVKKNTIGTMLDEYIHSDRFF